MDTALVDFGVVDLLSRITGQKLSPTALTRPFIFLSALVTVMSGVIFADDTVTDDEKKRLQSTLNRLNLPEGDIRQLAKLMLRGVQQRKIYRNIDNLLTLTALFSESEKLLLISFGYQMSVADGDINAHEQQYLESVAYQLKIDPRHLALLEASFSGEEIIEPAALDEVHSLLDPARFQSLDTLFIDAASNILEALPARQQHRQQQEIQHNQAEACEQLKELQLLDNNQQQEIKYNQTSAYQQLKLFQNSKKKLDNFCYQIFPIIQNCNNRGFLPFSFIEKIKKISQKLQAQKFRIAVVGEFSQGKSTLLNALLGEKIQPVRTIPCSGTVTVLKYGAQKRIVCRYKNGHEEEISFEQYQVMAAIPKEAALDCLSEELVRSDIDEIIFEHPDLELCRNGVEIVDSPGLNEHPNRTTITRKILKNTDAVIFLANASRPLTKWEQDYLTVDLRTQLNGSKDNAPADNIFIVVNFIDLLDEEEDRQDVVQRFESFVKGKKPIIEGKNRIHFISAKAALNGIFNGTENQYVTAFQNFTQSLEKFLTTERGSLKIKHSVTELKSLIQSSLDGLHQAENVLDGKLKLSEDEKEKIIEQIGEVSGRDLRIKCLADKLIEEAIPLAIDSFNQWREKLGERMVEKSTYWRSSYSHIWSQDKLIQDYANQFVRDLQREIDDWSNTQLREVILKQKLEELNKVIDQEIEKIKSNLRLLDLQINTTLSQQTSFKISGIEGDITGAGGFIGGMGAGGALAAGLFAFTGIGLVPIIIAAVVTAITGSFGLGLLDVDGIHDRIKIKVLEKGFERFDESMDKVSDRLGEIVDLAFSSRIEAADEAIKQIISSYENLLEQQEKAYSETMEQRKIEKAWINQQCQELEQVQKNIEAVLENV